MNNDLELLISFLQPIKDLLLDETVTEIMGNPDGRWWFERRGKIEPCDIEFDAKRLTTGLEVIANKLNRKLDAKNPLLNAQLPDGSRLAAVLPPVVRPFPAVTIRKFSTIRFTMPDLIAAGAFDEAIAHQLRAYIEDGKTMLISGGTGSGKTTLIFQLLRQIEERREMAIVYDPAGEFTKAFYKRDRGDMILNPLDARCPYWGPYEELRTKAEAATLAKSLYQPSDVQKDEFFSKTPQKIFARLLQKPCTPKELAEWMANPEEIDRRVAGTVMERMIPKDSPNQRNGVLASLGLVADTLEMLPTLEEAGGRRLVITEWAKQRKGWLFITSRPTERDALKPIISLWLDWLILQLLSAPTPDQKPVYLVIDELASLQRLPQLHTALTESRKSKNPLILGFQGKDQMDEVYGPRVSSAMLSQPATKIFLRTTENVGSEWISKMIGKIEIERVKETHSGGTNAHKTYTVDRQIDAMVMESEISGLEDKIAYMKLGNRVVRFNFPYLNPPKRTEAFIERRVKADELESSDNTPHFPVNQQPETVASQAPVVLDSKGETAPHRKEITELEAQEDSVQRAGDSTIDEPPTDTEDTLPPNTLYEED